MSYEEIVKLPWDDPNRDIMQDFKDVKDRHREAHYRANPYYLTKEAYRELVRFFMTEKKFDSVAIVSGGLDSVTLAYHMVAEGYTPHLLSFNYGQRHAKELRFAAITAKHLNLRHDTLDLSGITHLISNSALTSIELTDQVVYVGEDKRPEPIEVPDGHYAEDSMKLTVVPNRNMIMISVAAGIAVNNKYRCIATGVHSGDHFIYPDCRPAFIDAVGTAIAKGNEGFSNFKLDPTQSYDDPIYAPFINGSKADIAYRAIELGVPLHLTWSCYKGGINHCGRCGTCVERLEAIDEAMNRFKPESDWEDFRDQTIYEDTEFWKTAIKNAN
jgi:7-cyano-7-deazaguanine synthase